MCTHASFARGSRFSVPCTPEVRVGTDGADGRILFVGESSRLAAAHLLGNHREH